MAELKNIIETAKSKGTFKTLLKAADVLKLTKKYSTGGPYTVFAPVEAAFEPIPDEVVDESFDDHNYLITIINYHIVEGKYTTEDLRKLDSLETISGKKLKISSNGDIKIDATKIIDADIECTNGILHAIEDILIP